MPANVYAMRAPAVVPGCNAPIWGFPSQLHPVVPPTPPTGGPGGFRRDWDFDLNAEIRRRKEIEDLEALIALGAL